MKFKKGDLVQVKKWNKMANISKPDKAGDLHFGIIAFTKEMRKYCNKVARIYRIGSNGYYRLIFQDEENRANYYFSNVMLKKVKTCRKLEKKANKNSQYNEELL